MPLSLVVQTNSIKIAVSICEMTSQRRLGFPNKTAFRSGGGRIINLI
jgi:hypothetical protein